MPKQGHLQTIFPFDDGVTSALRSSHQALNEWAPETWLVSKDWQPLITKFLSSRTGRHLGEFINARLEKGAVVYPSQPLRALFLTPLAEVKVVILGQDPYHGPGQAEGLAFSVPAGVKMPPSLQNIFKEINRDPLITGHKLPTSHGGSLGKWANQGVLLLNTSLTVEEGLPASHAKQGWEALTDTIVKTVAERGNPVVFLLWGKHAQAKETLIKGAWESIPCEKLNQLVLIANHPSPLSVSRKPHPFLGCGHFSKANDFLSKHGCKPIEWRA